MKSKTSWITTSILSTFLCSFALTPLSGNIGGRTLDKVNSPYIVTEDIFIPSGETVIIKGGVAVLFKSFTGLTVFGSLFVEGSSEEPVCCSSVNDANFNDSSASLPKAFDWNGIVIENGAGEVKMRNFKLFYSVYGIKSKKRDIVLVNAEFRDNGQFNFTINDEIMMVEENISYSYNAGIEKEDTDSVKISEIEKREASLSPGERKLRTAGIVTLLSGGGCSIVTGVFFGVAANYKNL